MSEERFWNTDEYASTAKSDNVQRYLSQIQNRTEVLKI